MDLKLEVREQDDTTAVFGNGVAVMLTPDINEDYWLFRVRLSEKQAVVGFPKFGTIGIGFALEEDWNSNLPYQVETEEIVQHILHNKGDAAISDDDVRKAVARVQEAARLYKEGPSAS